MVNINGQMVEGIWEIGKIMLWMAKVFILGLMVGDMRVIMFKIKNMDKEDSSGLMEGSIMANGKRVSSMEMELTCQLIIMREVDNGKMEKE